MPPVLFATLYPKGHTRIRFAAFFPSINVGNNRFGYWMNFLFILEMGFEEMDEEVLSAERLLVVSWGFTETGVTLCG